jgi:hypothetical protein
MAAYSFDHENGDIKKIDDVKVKIENDGSTKQINNRKTCCLSLKRCCSENEASNSITRAIKILVLGKY